MLLLQKSALLDSCALCSCFAAEFSSHYLSREERLACQSSSEARVLTLTSSSLLRPGGEFTRQADVTFLQRNEKLSIRQEFKGIDEHDHLVMSTNVEGQVPEVPRGSTVQIEPYSEIYQYSNNRKGDDGQRLSISFHRNSTKKLVPFLFSSFSSPVITSSSTRDYTVNLPDGSTESRTYQWRQTITFQSCQHSDALRDMRATQMLNVDQVFVLYDTNDIIRFAMTNKVGDVNGEVAFSCFGLLAFPFP